MKNYNYIKLHDSGNNKKPFNTHLFITISSILWYMVDSINQNVLLKSINQGGTWTTIITRTKDFVHAWPDLGNERIYFITSDQDGTIAYLWYLDTTNDSENAINNWTNVGNYNRDIVFHSPDWGFFGTYQSTLGDFPVYVQFVFWMPKTMAYDMGNLEGRTFWASRIVIVGDDIYFLWRWSDENIEIWKYDVSAHTITQSKDCGVNTTFPDDDNQNSITYDSGNIISFVLKDTSDLKHYYYTYNIVTNTLTKGGEYNAILMLDRNTASGVLEKGFHITDFLVFQLGYHRVGLYKISDQEPTSKIIIAISDNFMFVDNAGTIEIWGYIDISDKIKEIIIDTKIGQITTADVITAETIAIGQTVKVYDDSDNLQFMGAAYKRDSKDGEEFIYKCVGYDKEISRKYTASFTSKTAKQIMQYILDGDTDGDGTAEVNPTSFLYYSSSIDNDGSFITTYTLTFNNKTIKVIFDTLMDFEDGEWYIAPDGKVYAFALVDIPSSGVIITQTSGKIYGEPPKISQMMWELNKISLYGAIVNGARLQNQPGFGEDIPSQQQNGINEFLRHYPHIDDQTLINTMSDAILTRTGLTNNPIYIEISFKEIGFLLIAYTLNFQFTPYPDLVIATDYYILGQRYYAKQDIGSYILSSGIIQEGREHEATLIQTSQADEEQIDILAAAGGGTSFPIGVKMDYFGTGIKGTISTRDYEISIANGDDFDMLGWYVANGQASTPNCIDRFIRNEASSGVIGGSDDAVVVQHSHNAKTINYAPNSGAVSYSLNTGGSPRSNLISDAGVSGVDKNIPAKISAIPIIKMS